MATHMDIPWKERRISKLEERVKELEDAIRKHRDEFPDEPVSGEYQLWSHLEDSPDYEY